MRNLLDDLEIVTCLARISSATKDEQEAITHIENFVKEMSKNNASPSS